MAYLRSWLCAGSLLCFLSPQGSAEPSFPPWVQLGADGRLAYRSDENGNRVPDFSNCGYEGGEKAIPDVDVKVTIRPGPGDSGPQIQAAIDEVALLGLDESGFRGAILLTEGDYRIRGSLRISASGIVLRGEGEGKTRLIATGKGQRSLILVEPESDGAKDRFPVGPILAKVTDDYVPVGEKTMRVDRIENLRVGQEIIVRRPSTVQWIDALGMNKIPPRKDGGEVIQWKPGTKNLNFNRVITSIDGDAITVDAPIVCALEKKYGGADIFPGDTDFISHVGVENLRGESEFEGPEDEDHAWTFVEFQKTRNAWVRKVTAWHFGYACVQVGHRCKWITVEDSACYDPISMPTGERRYSFVLSGQLTLVQRCVARQGRHDFVVQAQAAGPNAFVDCRSERPLSDSGPHHRWSVGVLYDNLLIPEGELNIRNRLNMGTGHGWAGANQVIWNSVAKNMIVDQPPTAQNWVIGAKIDRDVPPGRYWQSPGEFVQPQSLFRTQLQERFSQ